MLGHDVVTEPDLVRASIGLAGQYAAVDGNLTGRENLRLIGRLTHLPPARVRVHADELLERFGLTDAADRLTRTYSGGMRRRLDLAAALVHEPPVVFLDEPTTGLDPGSRKDLWGVVEELMAGGTTVLLTLPSPAATRSRPRSASRCRRRREPDDDHADRDPPRGPARRRRPRALRRVRRDGPHVAPS